MLIIGLDDSDDEESADEKKPKKVRFAEAVKAATKAIKVDEKQHPLLTDLEDGDLEQKRKKKAYKWFQKVTFSFSFTFL